MLARPCSETGTSLPNVANVAAAKAKMFCVNTGPQATEKSFVNDSENFRNGEPLQTAQVGVMCAFCGFGNVVVAGEDGDPNGLADVLITL